MKTDDLIDALAVGLEPTRPARLSIALLAAAGVAAVAAVLLLLGLRPDLVDAMQAPTPWLKGAYTAALALTAIWLTARLGRPGVDPRPAIIALGAVVAAALSWGAIEMIMTPPGERLADWLGRTWTICGRNILIVSAVAAPFVFLSARRLAPTRPSLAGSALGMATGGIAATVYGLLHCPEASAAFVATWYTLGVAAAGAIGAVIGRVALRW
ncbi:NrsF family protein [Brevundimonas nasdae]|uniref:DUF1109 domain-containing protein n=1 Tax=Brevundimonas nasdae TaxID=172043 RepID=A0ABX8THM1_9CAUL|nr:DUF1109 domain-containing protein [Brevundimonas nasdae]QYC10489.1 DUF1109 domain-containing protein [Brevundimonas nasdae]QYC13276.1 DUF1109 domain-containing protein [Brevundimonas nasdae]